MTFVFDEEAGSEELQLKGESYKYLIKVRRHAVGDRVAFRQPLTPELLHTYEIVEVDGRRARLRLVESREYELFHPRALHLGWCVIDPKSVEKVLPLLNELGVAKITFVYADRSQKNFTPDTARYERILQSSMQQCGRSRMMTFDTAPSVAAFLEKHPECIVFDFCERVFGEGASAAETVLIGPEGGFSEAERSQMDEARVFRLDTPMVLRSETAAVAISSVLLL
jgi:16S rRNA (uracil1498-N3)-methyltransferase